MKTGDNIITEHGNGIVKSIHEHNHANKKAWVVIVYPENEGKNKVYAHSVDLPLIQSLNKTL